MSHPASLPVVRHAFALRGVDPATITVSPHDGRFRIPGPSGGHVRLAPIEAGTARNGWSYTVINRFGVAIDNGGTTATDPGTLWPGLARHLRPAVTAPLSAVPRERHALTDLGPPSSHPPFDLQPDSPATRWVLALYQAWRALCVDPARRPARRPDSTPRPLAADRGTPATPAASAINADDLLRGAFAAIGLPADLSLDALALRVTPRTPGCPPARGHRDR